MASQVTKIALRVLYQTGRYHLIVGDRPEYKKIVIGLETLAVWAKRNLDSYDITITWREQRRGKILRRLRVFSVKKEDFLSKVEELFSRIFTPESLEKESSVHIKKKKAKRRKRELKGGGVELGEQTEKIETNIVILTPEELELKREDPVRYYQERKRRKKKKQWGDLKKKQKRVLRISEEEVYEEEELPEFIPERVEEKTLEKTVESPKVEKKKEVPALKSLPPLREPYFLRAALTLDHESLVTDDLLLGVRSNIIRYGLMLEPRLWKFTEDSRLFARGRLQGYLEKAVFRETKKRLPDEWSLGLAYGQDFFSKHLFLSAGLHWRNSSWGNMGRLFGRDSEGNTITYGIEIGSFKTVAAQVEAEVFFNLFGYRHGVGAQYDFPISHKVSYIEGNFTGVSSSRVNLYYDFFLGPGVRIRLGYGKTEMEIRDKPFSYSSSIIKGQFIVDMNL